MATKKVNGYTPTQERMLALLSDGEPHTLDELQLCLHDELGDRHNVHFHLSELRKILRKDNRDILSQRLGGLPRYRLAYLTEHGWAWLTPGLASLLEANPKTS